MTDGTKVFVPPSAVTSLKRDPKSFGLYEAKAVMLELIDRIEALEAGAQPPAADLPDNDYDMRLPSVHAPGQEVTYLYVATVDDEEAGDFSDTGLVVAFWAEANDSTRWLDRDAARELRDWLTDALEASR